MATDVHNRKQSALEMGHKPAPKQAQPEVQLHRVMHPKLKQRKLEPLHLSNRTLVKQSQSQGGGLTFVQHYHTRSAAGSTLQKPEAKRSSQASVTESKQREG